MTRVTRAPHPMSLLTIQCLLNGPKQCKMLLLSWHQQLDLIINWKSKKNEWKPSWSDVKIPSSPQTSKHPTAILSTLTTMASHQCWRKVQPIAYRLSWFGTSQSTTVSRWHHTQSVFDFSISFGIGDSHCPSVSSSSYLHVKYGHGDRGPWRRFFFCLGRHLRSC